MKHTHAHDCACHTDTASEAIATHHPTQNGQHTLQDSLKEYRAVGLSTLFMAAALLLEHTGSSNDLVIIGFFAIAFVLVGVGVLTKAFSDLMKGKIFTEFFLMSMATIGAFAIGEYFEAVIVMLFYNIGEHFQAAAVRRAKASIKKLIDLKPDNANVYREGALVAEKPQNVMIGEVIQVRSGEKIPLDGVLLSEGAYFNTAAITGEAVPRAYYKDQEVLAGMINLERVSDIKVTKEYKDSSFTRILEMVENAASRKAKTERFIRKFAKIYTPIVVYLAVALTFLPFFFVENYVFQEWFYRALVFLVISCPCALVISIPLGYFGGIGAASRNGILFKGANYLDILSKVNTIVADKTGTLTKGEFKVSEIHAVGISEEELLKYAGSLESKSNHPVAKAIAEACRSSLDQVKVEQVEEMAGHGVMGMVDGHEVTAGNVKLFRKLGINYDALLDNTDETVVLCAVDKKFVGYITIADDLKDDAIEAIHSLKNDFGQEMIILSGDNEAKTRKTAAKLGVDKAYGDLLPGQKVELLQQLQKDKGRVLAFVGDGINDAPVLAMADVGIAMGNLGSDYAIETADVVIQNDKPFQIYKAIKISKATKNIVWQNIILAFGVKALVLALGTFGLAAIWEAIFADVGVALLAILNAVRIQRMPL